MTFFKVIFDFFLKKENSFVHLMILNNDVNGRFTVGLSIVVVFIIRKSMDVSEREDQNNKKSCPMIFSFVSDENVRRFKRNFIN